MNTKAINQRRWIDKQKELGRYLRQTYATDSEWFEMRKTLQKIRQRSVTNPKG